MQKPDIIQQIKTKLNWRKAKESVFYEPRENVWKL